MPWSNLLSLGFLRGFDYLFALLVLPYTLRVIGLEKFGEISFALSIALFAGAIVQYGFGVTAVRAIALHSESKEDVARIASQSLAASLALAFVVSPVLLLASSRLGVDTRLMALTLFHVVMQSLLPTWYFQGVERMREAAVVSFIAKSILLACLLWLVHTPQDFLLIPALYGSTFAIGLIASLAIMKWRHGIELSKPSLRDLGEVLRKGRHGFGVQFAPLLYTSLVVVILGLTANSSAVGVYSAVTKILEVGASVAYVATAAFLPRLAKDARGFVVFKRLMLIGGGVLSVLVFAFAPQITAVALGYQDPAVGKLLRVGSVNILLAFAMLVFLQNHLMAKGRDRVANVLVVSTSIASLALSCVLVPVYAVMGAIVTVIASRTMISVGGFALYRKAV